MSRSCRPSWATCATLLDASDIRALVSIRCPRDGGEVLTGLPVKSRPPRWSVAAGVVVQRLHYCVRGEQPK